MLYFVSPDNLPLMHISCGQAVLNQGFVHPRRTLDTFVLLLGNQGTLHVEQNGVSHSIGPNQYALLFQGMLHFGSQPSQRNLSYYWCHFKVQNENYQLVDRETVNRRIHLLKESDIDTGGNYIIPETGKLLQSERATVLFKSLLDARERKPHSKYLANYALSLLAMEISTDFVDGHGEKAVSSAYKRISAVMEWVRVNYAKNLGVDGVAKNFNYSSGYLSNTFMKHVGCSFVDYVNRTRISAAKRYLLDSGDPVKAVAMNCGFRDEKYFTKVFKKLEGVSPSQYRNAFYRTHMST